MFSRPSSHTARCRLLVLETTNIFVNLAIEDAIFQSVQLREFEHMLVWRSAPCIVIGRHQNPWAEARITATEKAGVPVARRFSGGGAVFHDLGNLNLSFMTSREAHDRKGNLLFLSDLLRRRWGLPVSVSSRDDLLLEEKFKVSGTAAKLARLNSYHHCTLLLNSSLDPIRHLLGSSFPSMESKATASVPSPVTNLGIACPEQLISAFIEEFRTWKTPKNVEVVRWSPSQPHLPSGISQDAFEAALTQISTWDWVFGRTPQFWVSNHGVRLKVERGYVTAVEADSYSERLQLGLVGLPAKSSVLCSATERLLAAALLRNCSSEEEDVLRDLCELCLKFGA